MCIFEKTEKKKKQVVGGLFSFDLIEMGPR